MRRLTTGEATAVDLERSVFVAVVAGEVLLFRAILGGTAQRYELIQIEDGADGASVYDELDRYWALK